ncbi:hypothetical protein [Paraburkholderia terrae]|uniref:Uncharacterized protein n=1 Tax=Paraburkholderia terrae TaxID=311230 RepID=A0A2I8F1I3_9BURK|nr:hypothetical protein [Paraburkholderia terrae]AUT64894.1 hypothetical protein C2L65_35325 [Paraburkholderia terrae]
MTGSSNQQDRDNEIQLINLFTAYLREEAVRLGNDFYDFALGPQDVELGADWLYHADSRFLLVEYKATRDGYRRESQKPRREALCRLLARDPNFRSSHRKCHFIAWSTGDYLEANVYEDQVCNASVFPQTCPIPVKPKTAGLIEGTEFASQILAQHAALGLPLEEFERYAEWLMKDSSGAKDGSIQLLARNRTMPGFRTKRFDSVRELDNWLRQARPGVNSSKKPGDEPLEDPDSRTKGPGFRI